MAWLEDVRAFLPLTIAAVEADLDGVCLGGSYWRLRVNTNWHASATSLTATSPSISQDVAEARASGSSTGAEPTRTVLDDFIGDKIVQVSTLPRDVGLDLRLSTHGGRIFEIISDYPYGEWLFSVWRRGDERQVPVFDLEGPVAPDLI
ncbi:hypothetical protein [Couchioplanes azureus]|uniref:hypothetical protein n=1 Tax=Couchioplanes caeruleus TaxID=56438 RepID=UPI00166FEBDD|nr:hypothetical protein [Couchioplanes caeruleus]GGQ72165.1 hypothetical protein GCM10010166_47580 [Couchioplanes caeruleus subsp. azureus]